MILQTKTIKKKMKRNARKGDERKAKGMQMKDEGNAKEKTKGKRKGDDMKTKERRKGRRKGNERKTKIRQNNGARETDGERETK